MLNSAKGCQKILKVAEITENQVESEIKYANKDFAKKLEVLL